VSPNKF